MIAISWSSWFSPRGFAFARPSLVCPTQLSQRLQRRYRYIHSELMKLGPYAWWCHGHVLQGFDILDIWFTNDTRNFPWWSPGCFRSTGQVILAAELGGPWSCRRGATKQRAETWRDFHCRINITRMLWPYFYYIYNII